MGVQLCEGATLRVSTHDADPVIEVINRYKQYVGTFVASRRHAGDDQNCRQQALFEIDEHRKCSPKPRPRSYHARSHALSQTGALPKPQHGWLRIYYPGNRSAIGRRVFQIHFAFDAEREHMVLALLISSRLLELLKQRYRCSPPHIFPDPSEK